MPNRKNKLTEGTYCRTLARNDCCGHQLPLHKTAVMCIITLRRSSPSTAEAVLPTGEIVHGWRYREKEGWLEVAGVGSALIASGRRRTSKVLATRCWRQQSLP